MRIIRVVWKWIPAIPSRFRLWRHGSLQLQRPALQQACYGGTFGRRVEGRDQTHGLSLVRCRISCRIGGGCMTTCSSFFQRASEPYTSPSRSKTSASTQWTLRAWSMCSRRSSPSTLRSVIRPPFPNQARGA